MMNKINEKKIDLNNKNILQNLNFIQYKYINLSNRKFKNKKYLKYLFISLFLISYFLFFLSLEKCNEGWDECCIKIKWIKLKLIQALSSIAILIVLFELMFFNILSRLNLIHILIMFFLFYNYSNGKDFNDHGYYNIIGCILIIIIFFIVLLPFNLLIYIRKKQKYLSLNIFILLIFVYIFYYIIKKRFMNCDEWIKGLNNTFIDNNINKYGCQIKFPKQCPYKIGKYFMDITKLKGIKCEKRTINAKKNILKVSKSPFINNETKRIGYPLTNKDLTYLIDYKVNNISLNRKFLNNLVDMDKKEILNKFFKGKNPEIIIDFSKNKNGKMNINLKFNKTLIEKRKKKEKKNTPYSNNILLLYIDSVSRANSLRQLKKTLKFFEKFMSYKGRFNKKYPSENYHSFQFFKYHSFLYHTRGNYPILFYGNTRDKNNTLITKYLKENGYITCYCIDLCMKDNVNTFHNINSLEVYDHQFIICDPNIDHFNQNSIKCLYGKINAYHLYEYGNQFWRKYKNNRKFLTIIINDGHEGTLEALKYVDDTIFNFLNNLYKDNLLKDSSVFLLSDHGVGMPSIYFFYSFYKLEEHLPMLYIIINDRKNITYNEQYKYIHKNQQTLITGYDIYNTLIHIIYGEKYYSLKTKKHDKDSPKAYLGESLFNNINQTLRTTKKYKNMSHIVCK